MRNNISKTIDLDSTIEQTKIQVIQVILVKVIMEKKWKLILYECYYIETA